MSKKKYIHLEKTHNLSDPQEIVPEVIKLISPKSVVDFGCGIGTFLYCFKQNGITDVLGLDGGWVDKKLLAKYLSDGEFREANLEEKVSVSKNYDLVISLEVGEHLSEESANIFVENLVNAGKVILFSAAIPFQGGQNHINEQWLTYWEEKFNKYDYEIHDVLRPIFWDNPNLAVWYKQNMVLICPKEFKFTTSVRYNPLRNIVHPDLFFHRMEEAMPPLTAYRKLKRLFGF